MKKVFYWMFFTKIGKLISCLVLSGLSLFLANYISWMVWVSLVLFLIYPLPLFFVMLAYAWVINPSKDIKQSKLTKELVSAFNIWKTTMIGMGKSNNWDLLLSIYLTKSDKEVVKLPTDFKRPEEFLVYLS